MNIQIEPEQIRISLDESDVGGPNYDDLEAYIGSQIPLTAMYDLPQYLVYQDSVWLEILIPKNDRASWKYYWTGDEDDRIPLGLELKGSF